MHFTNKNERMNYESMRENQTLMTYFRQDIFISTEAKEKQRKVVQQEVSKEGFWKKSRYKQEKC